MLTRIFCALILLTGCAGNPTRQITSAPDVFSPTAPSEFTISAPFQDLFAQIENNGPDETAPEIPADKEPRVAGKVSYTDRGQRIELPVQVIVRGRSSKTDCGFPKFKLKFEKEIVKGTIFDGNKSINVGTHCDDADGSNGVSDQTYNGRVGNERGPVREALAYELFHILAIYSPETRLVNFTYDDPKQQPAFTRKGFFLADVDQYAKRLGGERNKDWAKGWKLGAKEPFAKMNPAELARMYYGEALIDNEDLHLALPSITGPHFDSNPGNPIWNLHVVKLRDGKEIVVAYDFDFASIVTGHGLGENEAPAHFQKFTGMKEYYQWSIFHHLQEPRSFFSREVIEETIRYFLSKRSEIERAVESNREIDEPGRKIFRDHVKAFYALLGKTLSQPVTVTPQASVFFDAKRKNFCPGDPDTVHVPLLPGLPVQVLETKEGYSKVLLLDVRDSLLSPTLGISCAGGPVWIEADPKIGQPYP